MTNELKQYKQAIKENHHDTETFIRWGKAIAKLEDREEALKEFRDAVETADTADGYFQLGYLLHELKEYQESIDNYDKAIEKSQKWPDAYNNKGWALYNLERFSEAIEMFKKAVNLKPGYAEAWSNWGLAIIKLEDNEKELEEFREAVEKADTAEAYFELGYFLSELKEYQESIDNYDKAIEKKQGWKNAYFNAGLGYLELGNFPQAIEKFKKAMGDDYSYPKAWISWGKAIAKLEDREEALKDFRAAVEKTNTAEGYTELGYLLYELERFSEAIEMFKKAINLKADYAEALHNWGVAVAKLEDREEALKDFRAAVETADTAEGYSGLGYLLSELKEYQKSIASCDKAIKKKPDWGNPYNYKGWVLYKLERFPEAIEMFKKAVNLNHKYISAWYNWGKAIVKLKDNEKELKEFRETVEKTNTAEGYAGLGYLLYELERFSEAIEMFKKAVDSKHGYADAWISWGQAIAKLEDREEALKEFRIAVETADTAEGYFGLGYLLSELKEYQESIDNYEKAIQKKPDWKEAYNNAGLDYLELGRYKEAEKNYLKATKIDKDFAYGNHGLAFLSYKKGEYKEARTKWKDACGAYERGVNKARQENNALYFLYYGGIYQHIFTDFEKAGEIYNKGLEIDRDNVDILLKLIQLNQTKKDEAIESTDEARSEKRSAHWRAMEYFRRSEAILTKRLSQKEDTSTLLYLGILYLTIKDYEKAKAFLQRAYDKDTALRRIDEQLGLLNMKQEQYKKAIPFYQRALQLDPDDLSLRSSLAEAYLKACRKNQAENEYRSILAIAPSHIEALIGLGETYTTMAEDAKERGDANAAVDRFSCALDCYNQALELEQDDPEDPHKKLVASEKLTKQKLSALNYSLGYCKVMLYEAQPGKDAGLLKEVLKHFRDVKEGLLEQARKHFKAVKEGTPNYYKACRAIRKIDERILPHQEEFPKWGARLILIFTIIGFMVIQGFFILGKPVFAGTQYSINEEALTKFLSAAKAGEEIQEKVRNMTEEQYYAYAHFQDEFERTAGKELAAKLDVYTVLESTGPVTFVGLQKFDSAAYALLTFGLLIFMVACLYLREISKLKFGAIELEKSPIEQASTSTSLGISKA